MLTKAKKVGRTRALEKVDEPCDYGCVTSTKAFCIWRCRCALPKGATAERVLVT